MIIFNIKKREYEMNAEGCCGEGVKVWRGCFAGMGVGGFLGELCVGGAGGAGNGWRGGYLILKGYFWYL